MLGELVSELQLFSDSEKQTRAFPSILSSVLKAGEPQDKISSYIEDVLRKHRFARVCVSIELSNHNLILKVAQQTATFRTIHSVVYMLGLHGIFPRKVLPLKSPIHQKGSSVVSYPS